MSEWKELVAKSTEEELDKLIVEYKYLNNYLLWALYDELKERNFKPEELSKIDTEKANRTNILEATKNNKSDLVFSLKKKMTINIRTCLPQKLIKYSVDRVMKLLYWEVVYYDDNILEAIKNNDWKNTERITVEIKENKLNVVSEHIESSTESKRNSKRLNEFKIAFQEIEKELADEDKKISELQNIERIEKQNEYVVPDSITKPCMFEEKKVEYLIGGSVLLSVCLGGILALVASFTYIIFLFDLGIGVLTALAFGQLIKLSKISDFNKLKWVGFASIALTYFLSQLYRFLYIIEINNIKNANLLDYFIARLNNGLQYKEINLGEIGLVIAWVIELVIAGLYFYIKITPQIIKYDIQQVPQDVIEFTIHWFNQGKSEDEVRNELKFKGWYEKEQQDLIMKAIGAEVTRQNIVRGA